MQTLKKSRVVYKGALGGIKGNTEPVLVILELPKGTKVRSRFDLEKNRANRARVLSIESPDGLAHYDTAHSTHDKRFLYRVGEVVKPEYPFSNSVDTCSSGIHFYTRRKDALSWVSVKSHTDPQYPELANALDEAKIRRGEVIQLQLKVSTLEAKLAAAKKALS